MADFDLSMALTADPSGFVSGGRQAEGALDGIAAAGRRVEGGLEAAERATDGIAAKSEGAAAGSRALAAAQSDLMQKTSAASQATAGAAQSQGQLGAASAGTATQLSAVSRAAAQVEIAETRATAAAQALAIAHQRAAEAADDDAAAQARVALALSNAEARVLSTSLGLTRAQEGLTKAKRDGANASNEAATASRAHQFAVRNAGQQVGDFFTQVSLGQGVTRAFASQIGQLGFALSDMDGRLGKVGRFFTGPWGIALTVGALVLVPVIERLFDASSAGEKLVDTLDSAAQRSDSFGNAQTLLGKAIDLATGKLKTHNLELRETIRLQAEAGLLAARQAENEARDAIGEVGQDRVYRTSGIIPSLARAVGLNVDGAGALRESLAPLRELRDRVLRGELNATQIRQQVDQLAQSGQLPGYDDQRRLELTNTFFQLGRANNDREANQAALDALDGKGIDPRLRPFERGRTRKPPKPPSTTARDEFDRDAADRLAALRDSLSDVPNAVREANRQVAQLDDLIEDLARRKPPGFADMIADAEALKPLIADSINRPYAEFIRSQQQSLDILRLQSAGRNDEAEALRVVLQLEREMGPLTPARKDAVLATVQALQAEQRQLEVNRVQVGLYSDALGDIRGIVDDATQAFVRGDLGQFIRSPGKLVDAFQSLQGQVAFEKLFGDIFRDLQDQVDGTSVVEDASERMAAAVDQVAAQTGTTTAALDRLAQSANNAASANLTAAAGAAGTLPQGVVPVGAQAYRDLAEAVGAAQDIVVTGRRTPSIRQTPTDLFAQTIGRVGERITGLFTDPESAARIGKNIGQFAGKGLEGAATGSIVTGVGRALGVKLNGTGAQVGGAIGNFLPIPGGSIIGSLAGGLVGNLFGRRANFGTSVVQGAGDNTAQGRGSAARAAAAGLGDTVQSGLQSIVDQLGGTLGNFNVSIGTYDGKYRVSTSGQAGELSYGRRNNQKSTLFDFGDDQGAALSFAIRDAIADGAVQGVSAAVQRALRSSTDTDRSLREALKVQQVEQLIGGLGETLRGQFAAFDREASERVRIARQYGLDVLEVERINGEQRAKLLDDALRQRVGSLQDLLTDLSSGNLFEGSAADRRQAILGRITDTRAKVDAGEEGATDTLAELYRQLYENTREGFGTAGAELSGDRALIESGAAAVIKAEQDRIRQAAGLQQAANAELVRGNTLTNETNDLIARQTAEIRALPAGINAALSGFGGGGGVDYAATLRQANLQLA